jgi:hypothetical protein
VLRRCLIGDAVVIDNVGHLATAVYILLLAEAGSSLISALYANTECIIVCTEDEKLG